ncbi:MAG: adenosylmethionine--8-amino-7-oxononanoate transaminase [Acidimicrobiaceae bacterium]|nr:adenosylmethionine--8-amino-7-oxononanoate transaminase [Acidimicrobiaceae bacterium]MYE75289.1 adenosylmethionine--8-amino-7-oxononanoate transaminase [Acidimicrobiaceae bacterium]MYH43405.1 adenosylmethionine--8-amino-7-oxononanoate transaminase [Acidimicrobiaceae bacterium]MYJ41673.1 adenosylmethionine--8-amino-7-oxononanoate transaminase [Acidimicrobiaceae bacterium]MYK73728.1 adenosylmethionine--8-amino-7-oxononanoate transaminase [Acidimicrobiaceae bacterium]
MTETRTGTDRAAGETLLVRDRRLLWHPYAPMPAAVEPIVVKSARGVALTLSDGTQVIDGMSSWWAAIHGYRHPVLDQAVRNQLGDMAHVMFGGVTHHPAVELAETLVDIAPAGLEHVFLADSGSVSVEIAIKMALQYARGVGRSERTRLLTVRGGYHGDTLGCMSVCDPVNGMHSMFTGMLPEQIFAPVPSPRFGEKFDDSHVAEFADLLATHSEEIAAVVIEPVVQGAGGMRFYSPDYLRAVRQLCHEYEVPLIADEIATGFGRSGELFGCDHAGVSPDIMCVGKALTGGYLTMAAVLCTREIAKGVNAAESGALMHGPTYMANPLAASVSLASIKLLLSRDWRSEVQQIEDELTVGLAPAASLPGVRDVRVLGAIGVLEMHEPVPIARTQETLIKRGVWLRPFGRLLYTMPPYVSSVSNIRTIASSMVEAARQQ